jgi:superfamily II DNA or RNA helicase
MLYTDCEAIQLRGVSLSSDSSTRTLMKPFDRIIPLSTRIHPRVVTERAWARRVFFSLTHSRPFGSVGSAASAGIDILPFQLEPALAVLRHGCTRVLLADEVGLGKTIQAGLLLAELSADNSAFRGLVLAPAALIAQWSNELRERFGLEANRVDAGWLSTQSRNLPSHVNPWSLPGCYVASIDLLKRPEVLRPLEDVTWDIVIADEAHNAAIGSARLAAAHAIASRARRVLLMTATPPDGDPAQLAALLGIGAFEDPIVQFRRTRADAGLPSRRRTVMLHVRLSAAERRMHRLLDRYTATVWREAATNRDSPARLITTLLRKRALSSAASLACSVQRRIALLAGAPPNEGRQFLLPLGEEDAAADDIDDGLLGAPGLVDAVRERAMLARLENLALAVARFESKIRALARLVRRVRQPAIVFTEYRDTLARIETALRSAGHLPFLLHGGMSARERADVVCLFNEEGSLLLATDAAAEGLNLHRRCRLVIHFELPWTPARLEQRTGRVDRLGQMRTVHEVVLVARDTAERLVLVPLLKRVRTAVESGARQSSALLAITESMVASGVIGGQEIGVPGSRSSPAAACRFIAEGAAEAERATLQRRGDALRPAEADEATLIAAGKHGASVTLLVEVLLRNASGQPQHSELVLMEAPAAWNGARRVRAVRAFLDTFLQNYWKALVEAAERHTSLSLRTAREQQAAVIRRLHHRDRAMLRGLPSAARRLVQIGLFDNRALKAMEHERRAATLMIEDAELRSDRDAERLQTECATRLVAVRLGRR